MEWKTSVAQRALSGCSADCFLLLLGIFWGLLPFLRDVAIGLSSGQLNLRSTVGLSTFFHVRETGKTGKIWFSQPILPCPGHTPVL